MKILNAEPGHYSIEARRLLKSIGELHEEECERDRLLALIPDVDILIVRLKNNLDREILSAGKRLKVIVTATTGLNHIDVESAQSQGITILSLQGETDFLNSVTATAELTWGLLLTLMRNISKSFHDVKRGYWQRDAFVGNELKNKTLGIIGYGRLGKMVAQYGHVFNMKVLVNDICHIEPPSWARVCEIDELVSKANVVSMHIPFSKANYHFINRTILEQFKQGACLVNTSRGEIVDEVALMEQLEREHIAAYATDVLTNETSGKPNWLASNPIWQYAKSHSNVIITPHIGGATRESMEATEIFMANKLREYVCKL